ncbi:ATP phosphoribosyltransferase [Candidatus Bipolaricaulota bacterium]|nr:ATP phosphoribosyltransferase [Candidatus Bipolaricaulota bacterium]
MKIVLPRGRLLEDSLELMREAIPDLRIDGDRELIHENGDHEVLLAKPSDVPVYVEEGADLGITGRDVVREKDAEVFIPISLPFGRCRLSVGRLQGDETSPEEMDGYRIATEYPNVTRDYFDSLGTSVEIIEVSGSTELAPSAGIADALVDIVQTGNTLAANGLEESSTIMSSSALLLVNRIAQKTKFDRINQVIFSIREVIEDGP